MTSYTENLQAIRKARSERDNAKVALYALQMNHIAITKEQRKFSNKEIVVSPQQQQFIVQLSRINKNLLEQLATVQEEWKQLDTFFIHLAQREELLRQLFNSIGELDEKIKLIIHELENNQVSEVEIKKLYEQKGKLDKQLEEVKIRTESLQKEITQSNIQAPLLRERYISLAKQKEELQSEMTHTQRELSNLISQQQNFPENRSKDISTNTKLIKDQIALLAEKDRQVSHILDKFYEQSTPQQLVEKWDDRLPVMLFPIRMETRFKVDGDIKELWVRIFPDDVAVVTHEKVLTSQEIEHGNAHWKAIWSDGNDAAKKTNAWRILTDKFGTNRATWIALQTKPLNWNNATNINSEEELEFPTFDLTKPNSWTKAPHTRIMPDKFVLLAYRSGKLVNMVTGKPLRDILTLGPAPVEDIEKPSITRNESDNTILYSDDFKWVADFEKAIQEGIGFRIRLDNETANSGYDQLLAVGLKISSDEKDGKILLEDLIDNHQYSKSGFSLVKQGTPTNNSEEQDAGFSKNNIEEELRQRVENDQPLFIPENKNDASDGQRLAQYLGIEYTTLQFVLNNRLKDHSEAVAINKALYASTLGYYLNSMLSEVISTEDIQKLRYHFTNNVTGRGPLATIRVGNQPYGILLTSDFSKWKYPDKSNIAVIRKDNFFPQLYKILAYFEKEWKKFVPGLAHISKQGNASANLINVLGLHPNSIEFFQRVGYSFDYIKNLEEFTWGGKYAGDVFKTLLDKMYTRSIMKTLGYKDKKEDGTAKPVPLLLQLVYQHYHTQLNNKNLIDGQPLSEEKTIKPYNAIANLNYIHWLIANASNAKLLESQDFGGAAAPNSLLYMMLLNALLLESSQSIFSYLNKNDIIANELIGSRKFMNITGTPSLSHWEIFQAPVNKLVTAENSVNSLYNFIHSSTFTSEEDKRITENLKDHQWALGVLKDLPTARLERAFVEHLDTLNYRLDSWQTSLFDLRLQEHRSIVNGTSERKKGIYIGAYGYLENIQPGKNKRVKVNEEVLPQALRAGKDNLFTEQNNGGFVHAPSLNHATAASILRNGYLTHANPADRDMLSVNLSSERVRRAKYLIDGVKHGQTLEVLLGYQFERGLHDWSTRPTSPVILNHLKPLFRKQYPIKRTKVPQEGKTTGPEEVTEDYHVVNGLDLARSSASAPYGIAATPPLNSDQLNAIQQEKENIADTLDALRDVLVSESAYQLALGNFERAAAVMQSISGSQLPTDIEVINTNRSTRLTFTNRMVLHFDTTLTTNPWESIPMTTKALTEPAINYWIGTLLGDPSGIRSWVKALNKDGTVLKRSDNTSLEEYVTLEQLQIQPLDLMYLIRQVEESGTSELETRIRYYFLQKNVLSDETIIQIEFANSNPGTNLSIKSFAEILPFIDYIRNIICSSRPLHALDYQPASKKVEVPVGNSGNINVTELQGKVQSIFNMYTLLFAQLQTAVEDTTALPTEAEVNGLRSKLKEIADAGFVFAFPQSVVGFSELQLESLVNQGRSLLKRFETLKEKYNANLTQIIDPEIKTEQKVSLLTQMAKSMLGGDFVVLPKFTFNSIPEVSQAYATRSQLLNYSRDTLKIPLPVEEFLHGIALVRPKMHMLEMIKLLNDTFNATPLICEPIQLPYKDKDTWLAVEFSPDTAILHDTLSMIQYNPQGFDPTGPQSGLLIDEWTETIPGKEEVTGITFNYNQPNSVPPQAILLAVTPEETGHWQWENLVGTILDTFERAKRRAVEPDHIDKSIFTTLLPAVVSEFSTSKSSISLDYSLNLTYVLEQVQALNLNK